MEKFTLKMMSFIKSKWDVLFAVVAAAFAAISLPSDAVCSVSTELIAFFGIQSAIILPAMIFTAGILKPNGLELNDARRYHKALKQQMLFWVTLLVLDFIAVAFLIIGKGFEWLLLLPLWPTDQTIDLSRIFNFLIFGVGFLAVVRTFPFIRGVISLLDLNAEMTINAIKRRNKDESSARRSELGKENLDLPTGYGELAEKD